MAYVRKRETCARAVTGKPNGSMFVSFPCNIALAGKQHNHLLQIRVNDVDQLLGRKRALCVWLS